MGNKHIDVSGTRYGMLVAINRVPADVPAYLCKCDCGNDKVIAASNLKNGSTTSCGCKLHRKKPVKESVRPASCAFCGLHFESRRRYGRETEWEIYCSKACADGAKVGVSREGNKSERPYIPCPNCGVEFLPHSRILSGKPSQFCSRNCQRAYQRGPFSHLWKGGTWVEKSGQVKASTAPRDDRKNNQIGLHRLICERIVGRLLHRSEPVLHINGNKTDNSPGNLFICRTHGECSKRCQGILPWPTKSNLAEYR